MRVVKIGGRAQGDPRLAAAVRDAWQDHPGAICVIHGGGDEISAMQRALGREASFVGGRRVTSQGDLELLRMVLSGTVNKRLVNSFVTAGIPAVGLSGEDGGLLRAEPIDQSSLGFAGKPVGVNVTLLRTLMTAGFLPVISPVGYNAAGEAGGLLNVNGDDAAAAIAVELQAEELLLIADVEGVRDASGRTASSLNCEAARELIATGIAVGGMAAKLESAQTALAAGVPRVRIGDLGALSDEESGTFIIPSQSVAL